MFLTEYKYSALKFPWFFKNNFDNSQISASEPGFGSNRSKNAVESWGPKTLAILTYKELKSFYLVASLALASLAFSMAILVLAISCSSSSLEALLLIQIW